MLRRLNIVVFFLWAASAHAGRVGEQTRLLTGEKISDIPESFSTLLAVADSFDNSGSIKAGAPSISPKVSPAASNASAQAPAAGGQSPSVSVKEGEKALPAKSVTETGSVPPTGEVPANDNRYEPSGGGSVFGGRGQPSVGTLLTNLGTGNIKSLSDTLGPVADTTLKLSDSLPMAAPSPKPPPPAKPGQAGKAPEAKKNDKDTLPGTPGDPNVGKATFGKTSDTLPLTESDKERREREDEERQRKEKEEAEKEKQESQEEKDKRLEDLKGALSGEISQSNYNKLADQILNNKEEVLDTLRENPELRANAKQLIEKFARDDRNIARKRAAENFLKDMDAQGALDGVGRPQTPPLERPVHNE